MSKKLICTMLTISLLAVFAGCGSKGEEDNNNSMVVSEVVESNETADTVKKVVTTSSDLEKASTTSDKDEKSDSESKNSSSSKSSSTSSTSSKTSSSAASKTESKAEATSSKSNVSSSVVVVTTNDENNNNNNNYENNDSPTVSEPEVTSTVSNVDNQDDTEQDTPQSTNAFEESDLKFTFNNVAIELDQNIDDVKSEIGEPITVVEAPSCFFDGNDKAFVYDSFTINTYPDAKGDFIVSIVIESDSVTTTKGAKLGMTLDEIVGIYGDGYTLVNNQYRYQIDDKYLYFYFENDVVATIGYVYANTQ